LLSGSSRSLIIGTIK